MSWSKRFPDPIRLPNGEQIETLADARSYILNLSETDQASTKWQTAAGELLKAANPPGTGPWIDFARIAMMQALFPKGEPEPRHKRAKAYKIVR